MKMRSGLMYRYIYTEVYGGTQFMTNINKEYNKNVLKEKKTNT